MKKITIRVVLLAGLLLAGFSTLAQTAEQRAKILSKTDVVRLGQLAEEYRVYAKGRKAEAYRQAEIYNWPLMIDEDGFRGRLMDVTPEGDPIYWGNANITSAITSRTNHLQPGGSLGLNLSGEGMMVGMWDGDFPRNTHNDFEGRLFSNDGAFNPIAFHPTHVLGTMIGSGASHSQSKGMAPKATGVIYDFDSDVSEMTIQAQFSALLLSNHSYSIPTTSVSASFIGRYQPESAQIDALLFAAPYYQPVFAAGNYGNGTYDRLTTKAVSKNVITVGAAVQVLNYTGPGSVTIAGFSNWGPTDDLRIKPDIVTKGVAVRSSSHQNDNASDLSDGTSMSSPGVTGSLILLQEHFSNLNEGEFMRSATLRGLISHTADEAGLPGPDPIFGWGLLNSKKAAETITARGTTSIMDERLLLPGQTYTINVTALGTEPLMATLAWTDPASPNTNTSNSVLVNNLDIRISKDGEDFYPWRLPAQNGNPAYQDDNNIDNIENIDIEEPSGIYTITISHKGSTLVNPETGGTPQQQYSLIVTGISDTNGVKDLNSETFTVWPNPAKEILNVSMVSGIEVNASVSVYDMQGRLVYTDALTAIETKIATENFSRGFYIVNVVNGNKSQVKRVVIE